MTQTNFQITPTPLLPHSQPLLRYLARRLADPRVSRATPVAQCHTVGSWAGVGPTPAQPHACNRMYIVTRSNTFATARPSSNTACSAVYRHATDACPGGVLSNHSEKDVGFGSDGVIIVADTNSHRICVFSVLCVWGCSWD